MGYQKAAFMPATTFAAMFSQAELQFIANPEPLLAKQRILTTLRRQMQHAGEKILPDIGNFAVVGRCKVSRGENLNGLPYLVLDIPQIQAQNGSFRCVRVLFWWGKMCSISLLLKGREQAHWLQIAGHNLSASKLNLQVCSLWQNEEITHSANANMMKAIFENEGEIRLSVFYPPGEVVHIHKHLKQFSTLLK